MVGGSFVGTASWAIPKQHSSCFPAEGSHLARYAQQLRAVEINSSFYRPHRPATYRRWAATVPGDFRFSVKVPKSITHEFKLVGAEELLDRFREEVSELGPALGPVLVQLPPSLAFSAGVADHFFGAIRRRFDSVVCEPRHRTWFTDEAEKQLEKYEVARVAADPAIVPSAASPGGWLGMTYRRLHGAPDVYRSAYSADAIAGLAAQICLDAKAGRQCWCIFDNTTLGEATRNALELREWISLRPAYESPQKD
ncbi:DUF72 domain-containing protein [Roseococcus sp. SYP-B2431]|uniref:DUF72 domain-containing protein n=1 Tax=Roseococcus sp. SYP-B2431 TaxID=2496640 RepID=UPI001040AD02|nr:DUF72 domain-containing protein [Roseococcus sp. SYP-B2431]TCH98326.1 DUF72 domain-containing protein [Roseococcus sp. SYP-B2431]